MSVELQNIDCNCNDCIFMVRDFDKFNQSKVDRDRWQRLTFDNTKNKLLLDAEEHKRKGRFDKAINTFKSAYSMKYEFTNDSKISFGNCSKFNKDVAFTPNTCQLDTQDCFTHRRD